MGPNLPPSSGARRFTRRSAAVFLGLVALLGLAGLGAASLSTEEAALLEKYRTMPWDVADLDGVTNRNGWIEYRKPGLILYVHAGGRGRMLSDLKEGCTMEQMGEGAWRFRLRSGKSGTVDAKTGAVSLPPQAGDPMPDFTLKTADGKETVSLRGLRGQVVLLDFFASWCGPCRKYLPETQALHADYEVKGLRTFGLNIEGKPALAQKTFEDLDVAFPVLMGEAGPGGFNWDCKQIKDLGITGIPHYVLIDKKGVIRERGIVLRNPKIIDKLLAEDAP